MKAKKYSNQVGSLMKRHHFEWKAKTKKILYKNFNEESNLVGYFSIERINVK